MFIFLFESFGKLFNFFFIVVLIIFGCLYLLCRCFYIFWSFFLGVWILEVWILEVNVLEVGFSYFISKFIFLNGEILSLFIMFLKLVFYIINVLGLLLNLENLVNSKFFLRRNCISFFRIELFCIVLCSWEFGLFGIGGFWL